MRELGYVEGQNLVIQYRFGEGGPEALVAPATELVGLGIDVLVTAGPGVRAAARVTTTTPIVFTSVTDPVGTGLIASFAQPGGNITGVTTSTDEIDGKRLDLMKEMMPLLSRVAQLWDPETPPGSMAPAARALGLDFRSLEARSIEELERAFQTASSEGIEAIVSLPTPFYITQQQRIVDLAARHRIPVMYPARDFAVVGGLLAYGQSNQFNFKHAATFVDRVLKGSSPAEIPVEQMTKFDLVLNMKTARALGLAIPDTVIAQATEIIE
jgi:putative ABC transport system substrate-binding protein